MVEVIDLRKGQDLPGCVNTPLFLVELTRCLSEDVKKPARELLMIFTELARYAASKDDPELNIIMLRLGLFKMPPDKLKAALEKEVARLKKDIDSKSSEETISQQHS